MIVRRISQHVRDQNWFAVVMDLVIVVLGVGLALMAQQWLQNAQQRADLENAEIALRADLDSNYFNAHEWLSMANCRRIRTKKIAERLSESSPQWVGMPWLGYNVLENYVLPSVLPTNFRTWGSRIWNAELEKGTFDSMDKSRRHLFDELFSQTKLMQDIQGDADEIHARLKALTMTTKITPSDRIRYFELLAVYDRQSGLLEHASQQVIDNIESIGLAYDRSLFLEREGKLTRYNESLTARAGECFEPIVMALLMENGLEVRKP